jgi:hypothetical protein
VTAQRVPGGSPRRVGEQLRRQRSRSERNRREEVEPLLEGRFGARLDRDRLEEAVGFDVRDEHERGAAVTLDLEQGLEAAATLDSTRFRRT